MLLMTTDGREFGLGQLCQHSGVQLHFQPAPTGTDVNVGKLLRVVINKGAQALFLPQRADAAEQIAGGTLRGSWVSHIGFLHPAA